MSTTGVIIVVIAAVVVIVAVALFLYQRQQMRRHYGPEYSRAVQETGSTWKGEARLRSAEKRVARFHIRPLREDEREQFATAWLELQRRFVDAPGNTVSEADQLVHVLMTARGYPMADFDQSASDIAVDHPDVVEHYRAAHTICIHQANGTASTEDLRQALVHYRALFDDLLGNAGMPAIRRAS